MSTDPTPLGKAAAPRATWLEPRLEAWRINLPEACRAGVAANAELIQQHWDTLRRAALFRGGDRG